MITFKDFFKKHLAFNLLALILPCFLFVLGYYFIPKGYAHWTPFHPMILFITISIIGLLGLIVFLNLVLISKTKNKKIVSLIFFYIFFFIYLLGYYFVEYFIFDKKWGFIADISSQDHPSNPRWIDDCLYTILAPSFVTAFVAVGVILFTVYFIQSARKNKQQATDTTTV